MSRIRCSETSVSDLEGCIDSWLQLRGSRDLQSLVEDVKEVLTWKSAPRAAVLAAYADLARCFVLKAAIELYCSLKEPVNICLRPT